MLPLPIRQFPVGTACWTKTCEYFAVFIIPLILKKSPILPVQSKDTASPVDTHSRIPHLIPSVHIHDRFKFWLPKTSRHSLVYFHISQNLFFFFVYFCSHIHSLDSITNNYEIMVQDLYCHYINKRTRKLLSLSSAKQLNKKEI